MELLCGSQRMVPTAIAGHEVYSGSVNTPLKETAPSILAINDDENCREF